MDIVQIDFSTVSHVFSLFVPSCWISREAPLICVSASFLSVMSRSMIDHDQLIIQSTSLARISSSNSLRV